MKFWKLRKVLFFIPVRKVLARVWRQEIARREWQSKTTTGAGAGYIFFGNIYTGKNLILDFLFLKINARMDLRFFFFRGDMSAWRERMNENNSE